MDANHETLTSREWDEYAEACLTHDTHEPVVCHAAELAHAA